MTTEQIIAAWTIPTNYCESRNDYYYNLHNGVSEIQTKTRLHDQYLFMKLGRKLPGTALHANYWLTKGCVFDCISVHDILPLAEYSAMMGFTPDFRFTKSGGFVRINNTNELNDCIRNHFKANQKSLK